MRWGRWPALSSPRGLSPRQAPPARGTIGRRVGSSSVDSPSSRFHIAPSRTHDLHKPSRAAEFASACRLPLSAAAPVFVSLPVDEFSCLARPVQRPAHVRQKICAADFPRRTCSCTNLRCRFFPLLAWLPLPIVGTNSLLRQALDYPICPDSPSAPAADSIDFADFVGAADSNTAPRVQTSICFVSSSPDDFNPVTVGLQSRQREPS